MYIASISNDLKIHTWPKGQLIHTYKTSLQGSIKSLSWSKDGSWLVLVPQKGHAEIISVRDNLKHLHTVQDIQQPTCAVFQNTTKRNIAFGSTTGSVLVYDIKSKNIRKHFPRAPSTVFKVEYCAKDNFLAAGCENGQILLYNSVTFNLSASYNIPNTKTVSAIRCHPCKRNYVAAGSQEGILGVWDIHSNKLVCYNQAHAAAISDLAFLPNRHDLIVSSGFDRKLAFYDITQKTCAIQKILEKSPTCIDFCPDSVGIAVGLQDGTIQAYDTRDLSEPLYTFKSHNHQIKQLMFQKTMAESTSEYTFSTESLDSAEDIVSPRNADKSKHSFDSLGHMFCGDMLPDIPEIPTELCSEMDGGDSFMDAIGLNSNNITANSGRDSLPSTSEGVKRVFDMNDGQNSPILTVKIEKNVNFQDIQRRVSETYLANRGLSAQSPRDFTKSEKISTPKFPTQQSDPQVYMSPILSSSNTTSANATNINTVELQKIIRDVIKQEIKGEMQAFQQELKYEFMDVLAQIRRHFLDLQMSIVKEFVQMESSITKMREVCNSEEFGEEVLLQENIKLRKELAALREQTISNTDEM